MLTNDEFKVLEFRQLWYGNNFRLYIKNGGLNEPNFYRFNFQCENGSRNYSNGRNEHNWAD